MEMKYLSWSLVILGLSLNLLGVFWWAAIVFGSVSFLLGFVAVLYLQHEHMDKFLQNDIRNPLQETKIPLGLNLVCDQKPIMLIAPNIKIQTESRKVKSHVDARKKSLIDTGFEILFKKHGKHADGTGGKSSGQPEEQQKLWKPFENIKIYTERRKSYDCPPSKDHAEASVAVGEDVSVLNTPSKSTKSDSSPRKSKKTVLSGNKQIDILLHTIIDYIIRDFIDSWFCSLSEDKEFSEVRVRNSIEEFVTNICTRIKSTQWLPLITTKLIDDVATHTRLYRLAQQSVAATNAEDPKCRLSDKLSPQRNNKQRHHRRNKSETDLNWHLGNAAIQKNVANSKFYTKTIDEQTLLDPEMKLLHAFFDNCGIYQKECLNDNDLEDYLTHIMETVLYFTLPEEDFACLPLRTFLCTLLANVVVKPALEMLADPDFINLQVARLFVKEPPPGEFLLKLIRQCSDLSELRACRQLITKEMDLKYKDPNYAAELASLKYAQKLIDLRISYIQNNKLTTNRSEREKLSSTLPILSLDDLLTKELALSYYLDYLSILNLQKYVIFYLTAQEWKLTVNQSLGDLQANRAKVSREEIFRVLRDKAQGLYREYLIPPSTNCLTVDPGLVEVLNIKLKDISLPPENSWFDSICKFVYEKLKNEDIFLANFYHSSAYKKLLLELDVLGHNQEVLDVDMTLSGLGSNVESGSDNNSGDIAFDDDDNTEDEKIEVTTMGKSDQNPDIRITTADKEIIGMGYDLSVLPFLAQDGASFKHSRSHSDCTGIVASLPDVQSDPLRDGVLRKREDGDHLDVKTIQERKCSLNETEIKYKLTAKIIQTALISDGLYAVYAVQVSVVEDNHHKSWHIYRRYSKFLELKKILQKRFPSLGKLPFPAKKAFQNTQRTVLEHRMAILNQFLREICIKAHGNDDMNAIIRDFLEPDTNDKRMQGGAVIRTIESLVNPLKTGMRTIRNMPDNLVGGLAKIFLGRGPLKEQPSFLGVTSLIQLESSEYPALASALNLLDEVFDLQTRSQWLRRGIINRLLGAPWVSNTANKKIIHGAKSLIEVDKIEILLSSVLNSIWPDGRQARKSVPREDNTKLRTRMAAKIALFALLSDDLKHVVGSETTRWGLLNFFSMWQYKKLNLRLVLVLLNDILTLLYQTDSMTKHVDRQ
ncbi:sorting nexin-13-like isoform X2 [Phlebotomus papatasi]|uniref:sorting nexin-13-like isoform X2 n=1 Tax=Phlebotomus papatasi TaxID=29031 RepID=UPI0024843A20|nr:sorting nexin-13-like isoform X2 [Phlebotomus papatasi]